MARETDRSEAVAHKAQLDWWKDPTDPRVINAAANRAALRPEREEAGLRAAVEAFIDWWDTPPFVTDDAELSKRIATLSAALGAAPGRRDPRVDWTAVEHLVDAAIRREVITAARGAEILGLRLRTWRERALEIRAEGNPLAAPVAGLDVVLASLDEDDLMYDHPVAISGEPMDPVLFVRWDALAARLTEAPEAGT